MTGPGNTYSGMTTIRGGNITLNKSSGYAIPGNMTLLAADAVTRVILLGANKISPSCVVTFAGGNWPHLELLGHATTLAGISDTYGSACIEDAQDETGYADGTLIINNSNNYSFNGIIRDHNAGSGRILLTKSGPGTLTIFGGNISYSGNTTIQGGALFQADNGNGLPSASYLALDGGVLQSNGATSFTRSLGGSGSTFEWTSNGGGFAACAGAFIVNVGGNGTPSTLIWGTTVGSNIVGTLNSAPQRPPTWSRFKTPSPWATRREPCKSTTTPARAPTTPFFQASFPDSADFHENRLRRLGADREQHVLPEPPPSPQAPCNSAPAVPPAAWQTLPASSSLRAVRSMSIVPAARSCSAARSAARASCKRRRCTLTLSGSNNFSGNLVVNNGTLNYSSNSILPAGGYTINGGTLNIGSLSKSIGTFQITGGTLSGAGTLTSNAAYDVQAGTVNAVLGGTSIALSKTGSGTAVLNGAKYTGRTTVTSGTLELGLAAQNAVLNLGGANIQSGKLIFDYAGGGDPAATIRNCWLPATTAGCGTSGSSRIDGGEHRTDAGLP